MSVRKLRRLFGRHSIDCNGTKLAEPKRSGFKYHQGTCPLSYGHCSWAKADTGGDVHNVRLWPLADLVWRQSDVRFGE